MGTTPDTPPELKSLRQCSKIYAKVDIKAVRSFLILPDFTLFLNICPQDCIEKNWAKPAPASLKLWYLGMFA